MDSLGCGEKGAPEWSAKGVGDPLVALFFKLVRNLPDDTLAELMSACDDRSVEGLVDLVVLAFQTRATRGMGKGEKLLFYKMLAALPEAAVLATLPLLPHYGYYKDYLLLTEVEGMSATVKERALELVAEALKRDNDELAAAAVAKRTPKLSMVAKYAPREGTRFAAAAKRLAAVMFGEVNPAASRRKYRQLVSRLNAALVTTEVLMAAQRWEEIEFARVASLCLQRHRKAFLNEKIKGTGLTPAQEETGDRHPDDAARVAARRHLRSVLLEKRVKGKALQPHEIARKCMYDALSALEVNLMDAQWGAMRDGVQEVLSSVVREQVAAEGTLSNHIDLGKLVPLVDVSGSMTGQPMEVAIALGLLVSELTHPAFRHRALTFESRPQWVSLPEGGTILERVRAMQAAGWGGSTNFEAACERILDAAQRVQLKPDEVPDLIVFSDMQFDEARGGAHYGAASWETHHERLTRRFAEVGVAACGVPYAAPRIIYWNLRGDTMGFPTQANAPNTQILSGFSPSLLKLLLSGQDLKGPTPAETVQAALGDAAFDPVRLALSKVKEGALAAYSFVGKEGC